MKIEYISLLVLMLQMGVACKPISDDTKPAALVQVDSIYDVFSTRIFNNAYGLAFDKSDNLYFADIHGNKIGKITPDHVVSVFSGSGLLGEQDGPAQTAQFWQPYGLTFDDNNLVVATNGLIRQVAPDGSVSTLYGEGIKNARTATLFTGNTSIAFDPIRKRLYVAQIGPAQVLQVTSPQQINVLVNGSLVTNPRGIALDSKGNLFVADQSVGVLKITPEGSSSRYIDVVKNSGYQDGPISSAKFGFAFGVAIDKEDNLYLSDLTHLRKITPTGMVSTLTGQSQGKLSLSGPGKQVFINTIVNSAFDSKGNLYISDGRYIRRVRLH